MLEQESKPIIYKIFEKNKNVFFLLIKILQSNAVSRWEFEGEFRRYMYTSSVVILLYHFSKCCTRKRKVYTIYMYRVFID